VQAGGLPAKADAHAHAHTRMHTRAGADEMEEDDEGDMDPRTLAQAAARLAKYTSEAEAGALPEQQWADLYNEGGALDVGEGAEGAAPCDFVVAPVQRRVQELPQPSQPPQDGEGLEDWHVSCGPHKVRLPWRCRREQMCIVPAGKVPTRRRGLAIGRCMLRPPVGRWLAAFALVRAALCASARAIRCRWALRATFVQGGHEYAVEAFVWHGCLMGSRGSFCFCLQALSLV